MLKILHYHAALTIAGSDSGGGAGIQADIKTFSAFGIFATSVITSVTAQNLQGVTDIQPILPDIVVGQLQAVLKGFPIKAVKTGMLFSADIIACVAGILSQHQSFPIVVDPVFVSTSGCNLLQPEAVQALMDKIFPLAALITPNIPEAEALSGEKIKSVADMESIANLLYERFRVPFLLKGGHLPDRAIDIMVNKEGQKKYESAIITGVNTHGSGCTLSAAIAAALAHGKSLHEAITLAKNYISASLEDALEISPGVRVINHFIDKDFSGSWGGF